MSLPVTIIILILTVAVVSLIQRWYRLRHIPGPIIAKFTDLYFAGRVWRGEYYPHFIRELHNVYGPVVRWGPNRVSFADPDAIVPIMGAKAMLPKAESYEPMVMISNGQPIISLITVRDEKRMTEIKKQVANAFSHNTWLKQEPQLDAMLAKLFDCLSQRTGQTVQLNEWLSLWAVDSMSEMAFSDNRHYLDHGKDIDGIFPAIANRFDHWRTWALLPTLERLIYKNPFAQRIPRPVNPLAKLAMSRIEARKANLKDDTDDDVMTRFMAASRRAPNAISPRDILSLTISTLNAGSETVAISTSLVFCHLLSNPSTMTTLEAEILSSHLSFPPPFSSVEKLPYLDACIRESMRISLLDPNCKERISGPNATSICDTYIPPGTDISVASPCTATDRNIYGPDADVFRPERWVEADETRWRDMDRAALSFSYGRRVCTGIHLARIEMKKVISALVLRFEMELVGGVAMGYEKNVKYGRVEVRLTERGQS